LDPASDLAKLAKSYSDKGDLVPDDVTIKILESEVSKHPNAKGVIYDGFPRTNAQAAALDKFLETKGDAISLMVALDVPEDELKNRLLKRAEVSGRADDADPEIIQNRIANYNRQTAPVADFYKAQGKLKLVNGIGTIDEIFARICEAVDKR
jgi:adenylate kinase